MINFASLFNQFRMSGSSIGDLIDSPGVTIDRLLDEESFPNQFKSGNSKVQQFMKYDKFETLVKYITEVGPAEDRKRSYKYPLSACELLSSDNNQILEFFFGDNPIFIKEQVTEEPEIKKSASQSEGGAKQEKPAAEKVLIKDNLVGEADAQAGAEQKKQTASNEESVKSENVSEDKSENETSQEQEQQPKTKIVEKQVQPLRHNLFAYFKGEVNYTLAGYVCKVFNSLFGKKPLAVVKFLLDPERFKILINHIESRSVGELVVKLLTQESLEEMESRKIAFEYMLQKVSENNEVFVISNLSASICETIEKVTASVKAANETSLELSRLFFTPTIITQIISNVMSIDQNVSVYNAPILLTYLTNVPLVIPEKSQITEDLKVLLQEFLKKTIQKLKSRKDEKQSLGFGRIKIVEIMSYILKENILGARELAALETEFFSTLLNLCRSYQYNNILHNEVVKIIEIALNETQSSPFLQSFLKNDIFLNFLTTESEEDKKIKAGSGSQRARKGYIGHIVAICRSIQENSIKNSVVGQFAERKQFEKVIEELVNFQVYEYNKTLAGYSMKRGNKHPILFAKQQILQEHIKFLAATPPPVFEIEADPINIQHPDLIEAEKVQMEAAVVRAVEQKPAAVVEVKVEEVVFNPKFFIAHLEYDVDQLMNDM